MRKDSRRLAVLDWVRPRLEAGIRPTYREIGDGVGMSSVGAWKHVQALIGDRKLVKQPRGGFDLPDEGDLSAIPTETLRGELERRGALMDQLAQPAGRFDRGRPCAANGCRYRVNRGMLMCRQHWFELPPAYRSDLMNAWAGRQTQAFEEALERARNFLGGYTRVVERVG